jgi:long-subunit fatty acid transport protein
VAAGYFYSENTTSTGNFSPLLPDTNLNVGSIGFGHKGEVWSWAISYDLITGAPRTVSGSTPSATGQSADGKYQFFNHALNLSLGYKF